MASSELLESNAADAAALPPAGGAAGVGAGVGGGTLLAQITAELSAGDDLRALLARLLRPLVELAGARAGAVRVLDEADSQMHLVASCGLPAAVLEAERAVAPDCGACGVALRGSTPSWSHDVVACARRTDGAYFGSGCRRILSVPLAHRARTLGIYNLFYDDGSEPAAETYALLESVGALLGLALDNVRLERENLRAALASERQAIAAEVHDSIGQSLAYVKMRLPLLADAIRGCDQRSAEGYFDDVRDAVRQAHGSLRAVLAHMRAPMDPLGLGHALAASAASFRQQGGITLEVADGWAGVRLAPAQEAQVFHIVQEALSNITRHAAAARAWLHLAQDGAFLEVRIEDDGRGLAPSATRAESSHYGLAIMRERARRLGGTLELRPRAGSGTVVGLRFPAAAGGIKPAGPAAMAPVRLQRGPHEDGREDLH